jgi:voltage-gated potassium channel
MLSGYAIIAVPTGIVGVEIMNEIQRQSGRTLAQQACTNCGLASHDQDAKFCKRCGTEL